MSAPRTAASGAPATMDTADGLAVRVRGLRMRLGDRDVLHEVDLEVPSGTLVAVLGPNGAGKTTTVEVLEGVRRRSGGEVMVLGTDPESGGDAWRSQIGVVLQSWQDHRRWRVGELLAHLGSLYRRPRPLPELLDLLGLTRLADHALESLSGGERRRVDLALGLVGRPAILFLDEPTAGLDPQARYEFRALVARLREERTTILLTTHDLPEAQELADQIVVLVDGRVRAAGTLAEVSQQVGAAGVVSWQEDGATLTRRTDDPSGLAHALHQRFAGPVPGLAVRPATLEEAYMELTKEARS